MTNLFLLLSSHLDPLNTVGGLDVDLDLLASQSLHLDQHLLSLTPERESHCNKSVRVEENSTRW